jgi:hypothetical protein
MRLVSILLFLLAGSLEAQDLQRTRLSFEGGSSIDLRSPCCARDTAVTLGATYGFRLTRLVELEAGTLVAIHPASDFDTRFGAPHDRFTWVHFGPRFILPVHDRWELSLGVGAVHENYSVNQNVAIGRIARSGWGGNVSLGAAAALDRSRHFWLGVTARAIRVPTRDVKDTWFVPTGNLSYRF